ncbi:MAG: hypothetical protein K2N85_15095 [Lachnospiraceae bacterium]|nr:hypothetical protein [Lachnospiraceae bacterium]
MHIKKHLNIKTFFIVLAVLLVCMLMPFVPLAVFLLIIYILFSPPGLDKEAKAQLNRDSKHAVEDAIAYLDEKYHMDYELNTFEPEIIKPSDLDRIYSGWYYDSEWQGEFTVDGNKYKIYSYIDRNEFVDNYQTSQIFSAYEELVMQYFPDTYEDNDTVYDVEYKITFTLDNFPRSGYFSTYYDGTNLEELLLEHGILIRIDIDDDVLMSDEFWLECEEALVNMEKDYEGAHFLIINHKEEE